MIPKTPPPPLAPSERVAQAPVFLSVDGARWLVRQTCSHTMSRDFSLRLERLILAVSQAQDARIAELTEQLTDLRQRHENLKANEARTREHYLARLAEAQLTACTPPSDPTP